MIGDSSAKQLAVELLEQADVVELPVAHRASDLALAELGRIYAFIYARVGNRPDAEDLTQEVALKAIPRLRQGAHSSEIRGYLFATARSVLGDFWRRRLGFSEAELHEDHVLTISPHPNFEGGAAAVHQILSGLSERHRRVLELRFLRGYSLKEVAVEMKSTVAAVKSCSCELLEQLPEFRPNDQEAGGSSR